LETFIYNNGHLKAGTVVGKGLCKEGKFNEWREELIKKGWLCYSIGDYSRHTAGLKLVKYINKEKLSRSTLATSDELFAESIRLESKIDATKDQLQEKLSYVESEVAHLKKVVTQMIDEFDPPATKEKIEKRLKVVQKA
jgi:hypothetical protein